jgi:SAM-dependent MidA family methyltransferase
MIKVSAIKSQGDFLKSWGIELRLKDLQDKNPELAEVLRRQVHRMIADDTMGKLFKVMELYSRDWHC